MGKPTCMSAPNASSTCGSADSVITLPDQVFANLVVTSLAATVKQIAARA